MKVATPGIAQKVIDKKKAWDNAAPERERMRQLRREEAERRRIEEERLAAERRRQAAKEEAERVANLPSLPTYVIQQVREVTVAAPTLAEAIEIGKSAFKRGQDCDGLVNDLPDGATGDTVTKIKTIQIAAVR